MINGRMYPLNEVLKIKNHIGARYLLVADGEYDYEISFGRQRRLRVTSECYIVTLSDGNFELEKIIFKEGVCDYLRVLKDRKITFEIPKTLPETINRMYSRFRCAIGATHWSERIRGFFGKNGYAITVVGYIGDDRYDDYEINFCRNQDSFHVGELSISRMSGFEIPKDSFIVRLLEEEVCVEQGEPLLALFEEAGILRHMEEIRFETVEDDESSCATKEGN